MSTIKTFANRHPMLAYYILVFSISVGGMLLLVGGPGRLPGTSEQVAALLPIAFMLLFAGPSLAGIVLTGLVYGRAGLRDLRSRLLGWRVSVSWYAVALLTLPFLAAATLFVLSLTSPVFLPGIVTAKDKVALVLSGIAVAGLTTVLEELGWTGFAVPTLLRRHGVLATGLIVGLLWGAWHVPITFWMVGASWTLFVGPLFFYLMVLPAYRVLMVWVYNRTSSFVVTTLTHTSLTACTLSILQPPAQGTPLVIYYLILAAVLWILIAAVATTNKGQVETRSRVHPQEARNLV